MPKYILNTHVDIAGKLVLGEVAQADGNAALLMMNQNREVVAISDSSEFTNALGVVSTEGYNKDEWDQAFSWGDHSSVGYALSSSLNIDNWNTAYNWGDHSTAGYLTSESDPTVPSHVKGITNTQILNWDEAYSWGNHADQGYLTGDSGDFVDRTTNQDVGGEKNFTAAMNTFQGRLGIGGVPAYGPSRLGDSFLQTPSMDVQSINFKDNTQGTLGAMFFNPSGTQFTIKGFDDSVQVTAFKGLEADPADANRQVESTIALVNDYIGGGHTIFDMFNQDYPNGVSLELRQAMGHVAIHRDGADAKKIGMWRYDGTDYTTIYEVGTDNKFTHFTDLRVNATESTFAAPAVLGISGLGSGNAAQFQFGDQYNVVQAGYGAMMDLYSYNTIRILGGSQTLAPLDFESSMTGVSTFLGNTRADRSIVIGGAASQTAPLLQFWNSAGTVLSRILSNGGFALEGGTDQQVLLADGTTADISSLGGGASGDYVLKSGDTMTGVLSITGGGANPLRLGGNNTGAQNSCYITFNESDGSTRQGYVGFPSGSHSDMYMYNDVGSNYIKIGDGGGINDLTYYAGGASYKVWHNGNDGSGSGLDADTLDGLQRSSTGDFFNVVPYVSPSGVMDVGRYIDFHLTDDDGSDYSQRLTSSDSNMLTLSTVTSAASFRVYQQSNSYAQLSAGVAGTYLSFADPSGNNSVIRSYGTSELYGGNLNVSRGAVISGDIGVHDGNFIMDKADGGQMNTAWEANYYRHRISGSGNVAGWRWDYFDNERMRLTNAGTLQTLLGYGRYSHHTGHLIGSYNNVGANQSKTNPIYTIGANYNPTDSTLSNMYGIGFSDGGGASFLNSTDLGSNPSGYGLYVASDGEARVFLSGSNGNIYGKGNVYASNFVMYSDERKKCNIEDLDLDMQVRWRSYTFKEKEHEQRYGVVAQELQETHPELVQSDNEGNLSVNYIDLLVAKMAEKDKQIAELRKDLEIIKMML